MSLEIEKRHGAVEADARATAIRTLPTEPPRVLRLAQVEAVTALRKTKLYELMKAGEFPRPIPLSNRARGWLADEVVAWIDSRRAARGI